MDIILSVITCLVLKYLYNVLIEISYEILDTKRFVLDSLKQLKKDKGLDKIKTIRQLNHLFFLLKSLHNTRRLFSSSNFKNSANIILY